MNVAPQIYNGDKDDNFYIIKIISKNHHEHAPIRSRAAGRACTVRWFLRAVAAARAHHLHPSAGARGAVVGGGAEAEVLSRADPHAAAVRGLVPKPLQATPRHPAPAALVRRSGQEHREKHGRH